MPLLLSSWSTGRLTWGLSEGEKGSLGLAAWFKMVSIRSLAVTGGATWVALQLSN